MRAPDDRSGANGLFTSHLITALGQPGLSLDQIFNRVRERVYSEASQRQLPWTVSSVHTLTGVHLVTLTVGGGKIAFNPIDSRQCNQKAFELPLANLVEARQQSDNQGEVFLNLRIRDADSTVDTTNGLPRMISPPKRSAPYLRSLRC